jgi:hypothetical protein
MTDIQLYFAIGAPTFAILISFVGSMLQVNTINARITSLETGINARLISLETSLNTRISSLEGRFETLIGKVIEVDTRLSRVEERLDRR